jgi:hypothetical protein
MTQPRFALALLVAFTTVMTGVAISLGSGIGKAFSANPELNAIIVAILIFGVVMAFLQVLQVRRAISWLNSFRAKTADLGKAPAVLSPITPLLDASGGLVDVAPNSLRSMLEGVYTRFDESREISRYLMNTLILLGLLGTFWGLLQTVAGIGSVIGDLNVGSGDLAQVFDKFKQGLQTPLVGMGISFSASLFGLASSLILGFFDLTTGRMQSRFCDDLEDWLSSSKQVSLSDQRTSSAAATPVRYQEAFIQNLADQLDRLQRVFRQQEQSREAERSSVRSLSEGVSALDDHLKAQHNTLVKLAELQQQVAPILTQLSQRLGDSSQETIEDHTRRIDLNLKEIGERVSQSADTLASELREELKIIAKILASNEAAPNEL